MSHPWRLSTGALAAALAVAGVASCGAGTPTPVAETPPASESTTASAATVSRYMVLPGSAEDATQVGHRVGCVDGRAGIPGPRVLFFGTQERDGRIRPPGTTTGSAAARVDEAAVAASALGWVRGFTECGAVSAVLSLAVNNKSDGGVGGAEAGAAWARLVERVAGSVGTGRVRVVGGLDGEPAWSDPGWARGWVDSYVATTTTPLYVPGSADGCPSGAPGEPAEACLNGWTVADVFHMATGAGPGVVALPQIYRIDGAQARQWGYLSRWGSRRGLGALRIAGALSQQTACQQKGGCARTGNPPGAARDQLAGALGTEWATKLAVSDVAWPDDTAAR